MSIYYYPLLLGKASGAEQPKCRTAEERPESSTRIGRRCQVGCRSRTDCIRFSLWLSLKLVFALLCYPVLSSPLPSLLLCPSPAPLTFVVPPEATHNDLCSCFHRALAPMPAQSSRYSHRPVAVFTGPYLPARNDTRASELRLTSLDVFRFEAMQLLPTRPLLSSRDRRALTYATSQRALFFLYSGARRHRANYGANRYTGQETYRS